MQKKHKTRQATAQQQDGQQQQQQQTNALPARSQLPGQPAGVSPSHPPLLYSSSVAGFVTSVFPADHSIHQQGMTSAQILWRAPTAQN
jgi:hypothetical protein